MPTLTDYIAEAHSGLSHMMLHTYRQCGLSNLVWRCHASSYEAGSCSFALTVGAGSRRL